VVPHDGVGRCNILQVRGRLIECFNSRVEYRDGRLHWANGLLMYQWNWCPDVDRKRLRSIVMDTNQQDPMRRTFRRETLGMLMGVLFAFPRARADEPTYVSSAASFPLQPAIRIAYDAGAAQNAPADYIETHRLRTLRLGLSAVAAKRFHFYWQYDLAANVRQDGPSSLRYAVAQYDLDSRTSISAGQTDEPFGLEAYSSDRSLTFAERGLNLSLVPLYHLGALLAHDEPLWGAAVGVFGRTIANPNPDAGHGESGRAYIHWIRESSLLHLGVSLAHRTPEGGILKEKEVPESALVEVPLTTGRLKYVSDYNSYSLEFAGIWRSLSFQAEYTASDIARQEDNPSLRFDGAYIFASWFITGEHRNYVSRYGGFGPIRPLHWYGAWELGARYSQLYFNSRTVAGGAQRDVTLAANDYITRQLRLSLNWIQMRIEQQTVSTPRVFEVRLQFDY
jgi:phosphate-selective porin OprO and OprP